MVVKIGVQESAPQKIRPKIDRIPYGENVSKSAITGGGGGILAGRVGPGCRLRLFELRFNNARANTLK